MKLNKHQKEIVKKILEKEVYDTYSYLKCFKKLHIEKYDIEKLRESFNSSENGKKYKVMKEGFSRFTTTSSTTNILNGTFSVPMILPRMNIPENEWEYKEAKFNPNIKPIKYTYNDEEFSFDFVNDNIEIMNDFQDLIDFFALWNFLLQEALVFELEKPVNSKEIGLFFKSKPVEGKNKKPHITVEYSKDKVDNLLNNVETDYYDHGLAPARNAAQYIDNTWEIDDESIIMSKEYIGRKIVPTSSLRTYAQFGFKTFEERSQSKNLIVAWIAVIISVVSVVLGNILPLTKTDTTEYIISIEQQLSELNQKVDSSTINDISEIKDFLSHIEQEVESMELDEKRTIMADIKETIEKIEKIIKQNNY